MRIAAKYMLPVMVLSDGYLANGSEPWLIPDPATLPPELRVTAWSESDRVIRGIRHVSLPLEGVQFHPESVLTPQGPHLLANFLRQAGEGEASRLDDAAGSFATSGMAERVIS